MEHAANVVSISIFVSFLIFLTCSVSPSIHLAVCQCVSSAGRVDPVSFSSRLDSASVNESVPCVCVCVWRDGASYLHVNQCARGLKLEGGGTTTNHPLHQTVEMRFRLPFVSCLSSQLLVFTCISAPHDCPGIQSKGCCTGQKKVFELKLCPSSVSIPTTKKGRL